MEINPYHPTETVSAATEPESLSDDPRAGRSGELLALALPLVVSQSFMTVQVFIDTLLLSWYDPDAMAASFPAVMWYWLGFGLLQVTAGYTSTFVAQYTGAQRPQRVGPAVWQGMYFSVVAGMLFLGLIPLAPHLIALGQHTPRMQQLETLYLQWLAGAAFPMLLMAALNGFFSGRGQTWTVLGIEALGTLANIVVSSLLIFGEQGISRWNVPGLPGVPPWGIAGAGCGTVIGSWVSAIFALALFWRREHRVAFRTFAGWQFERDLFLRLLRFGGPAGIQVFLDVLVFHLFVTFVGRLGDAELGATTLAVRLNMIAFLPMMGLGQAICILVGQRLGANRPDLAERTTYTGLRWVCGYMSSVALLYLLAPELLVNLFAGGEQDEKFSQLAALVPRLLTCVAIYSLADGVNVSFAFALRGAGDTRFVTLVTFLLAWPLMVIPTYLVVQAGGSLYWAWAFATLHIFAMALCFWLRFRTGLWKTMRVIEEAVVPDGV
jgi:MATE family multidrug resistance protein